MAPQSARKLHSAGPFVTLSLPRNRVSELLLKNVHHMVPPNHSSPTFVANVDEGTKASPKSSSKAKQKAQTPNSTPSRKRRKPSRIATFYLQAEEDRQLPSALSSPSIANTLKMNGHEISIPASEARNQNESKHNRKEGAQSFDGQNERRSSTASLTDGGMRSSHRARKLTTKAQALAGTNFLPSLQNTSDADVLPSPTFGGVVDVQTILAEPYETNTMSKHNTLDRATTDALFESVETPSTRASTRERKPTARAIELETIRSSRKRPASPTVSDRAPKIAKTSPATSIKPSKLRHSAVELDDSHAPEPLLEIGEATEHPLEPKETNLSEGIAVTKSLAPEISTKPATNDLPDPDTIHRTDAKSLEEVSPTMTMQEKDDPPACDLKCLSPSARLLAFAKLASDWPDSDDEDISDEDILDLEADSEPSQGNSDLLKMLRQAHCRCEDNVSNSVPEKARVKDDSVRINSPAIEVVQTVRKSKRHRPQRLRTEPQLPSPKVSRVNKKKKTDLVRRASSFEQRMQADYLASHQDKTAATSSGTIEIADPATEEVSVERFPGPAIFSAQPIRFQVHDPQIGALHAHVNDSAPGRDDRPPPESWKSYGYPKSNGQKESRTHVAIAADDSIPATQSKEPPTPATVSSSKAKERPVEKKRSSASNNSIKLGAKPSGGKSSAAGSVRANMQDKSEHKKEAVVKQYQTIPPPQPKSIKLRFTNSMAK